MASEKASVEVSQPMVPPSLENPLGLDPSVTSPVPPEARSSKRTVNAPIPKFNIPALTAEAKLNIREMQLQVLSLRDQARNLLAQSQNMDQQLVAHYNELAQQMEVDTDKFGFDPATLTFHPLQKGA